MKRNPRDWVEHFHELSYVLGVCAERWPRAIDTITEMMPGLAGAPSGVGGGSGGNGSIVERLALSPSAERQQHDEMTRLPAEILGLSLQAAGVSVKEPTTNWGRIQQSQLLVLAATRRRTRPAPRLVKSLTHRVWRLEQLVNLWAVGDDQQRSLRKEAGGPATSNDEIWCLNCRQHGHTTPRHASGSKFCKWCQDFKREWGILPDKQLLDSHHRRRINSGDIQRALQRAGSRRKVVA